MTSEGDKVKIFRLCLDAITSVSKALSELKELQKEANSEAISRGLEIILPAVTKLEKVADLDRLKLFTLCQRTRQSRKGLSELRKLVQVCILAILHSLLTMAHDLL